MMSKDLDISDIFTAVKEGLTSVKDIAEDGILYGPDNETVVAAIEIRNIISEAQSKLLKWGDENSIE